MRAQCCEMLPLTKSENVFNRYINFKQHKKSMCFILQRFKLISRSSCNLTLHPIWWYLQLNQKSFGDDYAVWIVVFWRKSYWDVKFQWQNRSIINKVDSVASLFAKVHRSIPLGARMHPSGTNDHELGSLHKGYLLRSPQHMQQIHLMTNPSIYVCTCILVNFEWTVGANPLCAEFILGITKKY